MLASQERVSRSGERCVMNLRTLETAARPAAKAAKGAALGLLRLRHALRGAPREFVFVNSAPRSGTTLMSNILCSHPQICGYGETKTVYRSPADLSMLAARVYWGNRRFLRMHERFVHEKIVWSRMLPDPDALNDAAIRWIFLLRGPASVLRSCMEYRAFNWNEAQALAYYEHRLPRLAGDARHFAAQGHRAMFLTYEQLISNPKATLQALSRFLELEGELEPGYRLPPTRTGDRSGRIDARQIIAEPRQYRTELSPATLERALAVYAECSTVLRQHCEVVV
jgi:hypothetical protein